MRVAAAAKNLCMQVARSHRPTPKSRGGGPFHPVHHFPPDLTYHWESRAWQRSADRDAYEMMCTCADDLQERAGACSLYTIETRYAMQVSLVKSALTAGWHGRPDRQFTMSGEGVPAAEEPEASCTLRLCSTSSCAWLVVWWYFQISW